MGIWRVGGIALVVAALMGIAGQLLHPASVSAVDHPAMHIQEVATSPVWVLSHTLFLLAFLVNLVGLWALAELVASTGPADLARLAYGVGLVGSAVSVLFITVDGFGVKLASDAWATGAAQDQAILLQVAVGFDVLEDALFGVWLLTYFGLTGLVYGAVLRATNLPRWISTVMLLGGSIGTINGLAVLLAGISVPSFIALGPAALGFWVPLLTSGVLLWRRAGAATARPALQ